MYHVIRGGGLGVGGMNFDAKVRRQSFTPEDMVHAHIGGVDLCAHAFLHAAKLVEEGNYEAMLAERYSGWETTAAKSMLAGTVALESIAAETEARNIDPKPRSGRQEQMENFLLRQIL